MTELNKNITDTDNNKAPPRPWQLLLLFPLFGPPIPALPLVFEIGSGDGKMLESILTLSYLVGAIPAALTALAAIMMELHKGVAGVMLCTIVGAISAFMFGGIGLTFYGSPFVAGVPLFAAFGAFAGFILALIFLPRDPEKEINNIMEDRDNHEKQSGQKSKLPYISDGVSIWKNKQ